MTLEQKINYVAENVLNQAKGNGYFVSFNEQSNELFDRIIHEAYDVRKKPSLAKEGRFLKRMTRMIISEMSDDGEFLEGLIEAIETAKLFRKNGRDTSKQSRLMALKYNYLTYHRMASMLIEMLSVSSIRGLSELVNDYRERVNAFEGKVEIMPHESIKTYQRLIAYDVLSEQENILNIARLLL